MTAVKDVGAKNNFEVQTGKQIYVNRFPQTTREANGHVIAIMSRTMISAGGESFRLGKVNTVQGLNKVCLTTAELLIIAQNY